MKRVMFFVYGLICYLVFFTSFVYMIGFLTNSWVPKSVDSGEVGAFGPSLLINLGLIALFGLQHSVMARPGFKAAWTRLVPKPIERSTYVLLGSSLLWLLYALWQPMPTSLFSLDGTLARQIAVGLCLVGFLIVLLATLAIDHFDLFGLRQVFLYLRGKPYHQRGFAVPTMYRFVRHPLYVGWFVAFWVTPDFTIGHLVYAAGMTACILIAIPFEERDLVSFLGDDYRRYRETTPMLIPHLRRR